MGLVESAASGDRRKALEDLRDTLASAIATTDAGRDIAALARQFSLVLSELDTLQVPKEASKVDDLAARRTRRRSASGQ